MRFWKKKKKCTVEQSVQTTDLPSQSDHNASPNEFNSYFVGAVKRCSREQGVQTLVCSSEQSVQTTVPPDHNASSEDNLTAIHTSAESPDGISRARRKVTDNQIFQELTCPVCAQIYTDPVIFPCLHSLCHDCSNAVKRTSSRFLCPECRNPVSQEPKKNFPLQKMVDLFQQNLNLQNVRRMVHSEASQRHFACDIQPGPVVTVPRITESQRWLQTLLHISKQVLKRVYGVCIELPIGLVIVVCLFIIGGCLFIIGVCLFFGFYLGEYCFDKGKIVLNEVRRKLCRIREQMKRNCTWLSARTYFGRICTLLGNGLSFRGRGFRYRYRE